MNTAKFFSPSQESSTIFSSSLHTKQLKSINKKVIKIDSILKDSFTLRKKLQEKTVIKKSQLSFQEKEKNLEKEKLPKSEKGIKSVPTPSGGGIFGWIGNFINNVIFGFIAIRLIDHLPKLLSLVPVINGVMNSVIDWGGKLLEGLVTFIDWGYSAYDNTVKVFTKFGGEGAAKKFEEFMGKFKDVLNYSIIAGMLFSDLALSGGGGGGVGDVVGDVVGDQLQRRVVEQGGRQVAQQAGTQAARTAGIGVGGATLIVAGVGLLASALGEGAFQLKKFSKKIEKDAFKKRDQLKKNWEKTPAWNILGKAWNAAQYAFFESFVVPGMRLTNWILNGLGITLDIVGAPFRYAVELIRWALMALNNDTKGMAEQKKNLSKFDARIRDGIREHFAGFLGPIFRVIGKKDWADNIEKQGSWGSLYGNKAVKDMYGYASGGSTRGGQYLSGSARREIRPQKKLRRVVTKPAKLYQGRTAGGIDNIQKVFPEAKNITTQKGTGPQTKDETMNPYGFMSHSYYRLASVPFVGPILAMPLKVMMGDTIDSAYYTSVGQGFSGLMAKAYDEGAFSDDFPIQEFDFEKIVSKSVQQLATREITSVRSELMRQLGLEKAKPTGGDQTEGDECICPEDGGIAGANIQGGTSDFWTLVALASREDGDPQSWADVAQSVYNRLASGAYSGKTIKDLITATWQYEPTWRYPSGGSAGKPNRQWFTITDAASAAAASGQSIDAMKSVASALLNPSYQANARSFVQGRTDFTGYAKSARTGQIQRKSGDNYFGWDWTYKGNTVASVPNFSASASSSGPAPTLIASSSPAGSVSDCSCDGDNIPDTGGITTPTDPAAYGEGKGKQIYLHWTAGGYSSIPRGSYHTVITGDGKAHNVIPYTQKGEHTYRRNTNSVGLSLAAMGGSPDPWSIPPTAAQLSGMALETAKIAKAWGWSASDINIKNVLTHAEAGSNKDGRNMHDNYGPKEWGGTGERWDLFQLQKGDPKGSGGDKIRSMIKSKMGSAGKFGGGPINEGLTKVHPGEFVIDRDSVDLFGMEFMNIINQVENKSQLRRAKDSLIQILMEKVPYYSDMAPDEYITVPSSGGGYAPNVAVLSGSVSSGGGSDSCPWGDKMEFGN